MTNRFRARIVMLAFMVAVSHVALVSHVTAHFKPALEHCELCVSQAQPLAAIPEPGHGIVVPRNAAAIQPPPGTDIAGHSSPAPYLQRAPPPPSP